MADELEVNSPAWWLHRLAGQLASDQARMVLMDRYYRGAHPLPYVPRSLKVEFRRMLARSRSNFMRIVVEAPGERLRIQGFRAEGSDEADREAWDAWLASGMDAGANQAINDSLALGRSYLSVWRHGNDDIATIHVEDPRTALVEYDRVNRAKRVAGLRLWVDDWTGATRADVWLEDACYQFTANKPVGSKNWPPSWQPAAPVDDESVAYQDLLSREEPIPQLDWVRQWTEIGSIPNPWREIPLVPLVNRPSVLKRPDGESEFEDAILTQDRINEMLFNRALAAWTTAYRQKWATGLEIPVDENGNEVEPFQAAIDRLWVAEDPTVKFGEFGATDLKPFIDAVEQDVQHIAVQTRTPRHYFHVQGQDPSGDAMKSAESGLIAKVYEKQPVVGRAMVEAQRLQALMSDRPAPRMAVVWGDPENRTLAETTDAVIKQHAAGLIPRRVALEKLGYSPAEIARMDGAFTQEALVRDLMSGDDGVPAA